MACDDSYAERDPAQRRDVRRRPMEPLARVVARRKQRDKDAFFGARAELADLQDGMWRLSLGARLAGDPGFRIPDNDNGFDYSAH